MSDKIIEVQKGDIIESCGERVVIDEVLCQHVDTGSSTALRAFADIEFKDENGNYRHWQSWHDGGTLIIQRKFDFEKE